MYRYPFAQPVTFILFRAGRVVLLLSIITFAVFLALKDVIRPSVDNETLQTISMAWGLFTTILALATLWLFVAPERIERLFTHRAHFEGVLYRLIMEINKKSFPEEVRVTLYEAYLTDMRDRYALDPAEHLGHLPDVEADVMRRVCADLITKEKLRLAESLKRDMCGASIQNKGLDIARLEVMNHVLNERFKGIVLTQTNDSPAFGGMTSEA